MWLLASQEWPASVDARNCDCRCRGNDDVSIVGFEPVGEVALEHWSIRQTSDGIRHFVSWNGCGENCRVSTPIVSFDPQTRTGTLRSGSTHVACQAV